MKDYKDGGLLLPQYAAAHQLRSTLKDHEDTDGRAAALNGLSIETNALHVPHGPAFFHRMPAGEVALYRLETSARRRGLESPLESLQSTDPKRSLSHQLGPRDFERHSLR